MLGLLVLAIASIGVFSADTGEKIAIKAIEDYLSECAKQAAPHAALPYDAVEAATRDETGTGWTEELYGNTLLHRWSEDDEQDTMLSTTVNHLVVGRSAVRIDHGIVKPVDNDDDAAVDVVKEINNFHKNFDNYNAPGTVVVMEKNKYSEVSSDTSGSNIFDASAYRTAILQTEGTGSPALPAADKGSETANIENWIRENVPAISSKEDLAYYGYYKVTSDQKFIMESPVGFWPTIPTYVGDEYSKHVRGGLYLERHAPIHTWSPTTEHAAEKGYLLTMVPVDGATWDNGWKFDIDNDFRSNAPPYGKYKLARIPIGYGETVLANPYTWHADATLGGGLHLMSFSFGPGPNGDKSDLAAASGFQPIFLPGSHSEL